MVWSLASGNLLGQIPYKDVSYEVRPTQSKTAVEIHRDYKPYKKDKSNAYRSDLQKGETQSLQLLVKCKGTIEDGEQKSENDTYLFKLIKENDGNWGHASD